MSKAYKKRRSKQRRQQQRQINAAVNVATEDKAIRIKKTKKSIRQIEASVEQGIANCRRLGITLMGDSICKGDSRIVPTSKWREYDLIENTRNTIQKRARSAPEHAIDSRKASQNCHEWEEHLPCWILLTRHVNLARS